MKDKDKKAVPDKPGQDRRPPPEALLGFSDRVTASLRKKGWNQAELARRLGMNGGHLSGILSGKRLAGITAANVIRIAEALEESPGYLLTGESQAVNVNVVPVMVNNTTDYADAVENIRRHFEKPHLP